jgi:hypothetical protein
VSLIGVFYLLGLPAHPAASQLQQSIRTGATSPEVPASPDEIQFRPLREADFLSTRPPQESAGHPAGVNAVSCLRIGWLGGFPIEFTVRGKRVSAVAPIPRFVAFFDRRCSWWSPTPEDPSYALLHEQVHFAIAEHAARTLTEESKGRVVRGFGSTSEEAQADLEESLRLLASQARWAARRKHDAFDSETSRDRSRALQQKWVDRYQERLGTSLSPDSPR